MREYNNSNPNIDKFNRSTWFRSSLDKDTDWREKAACREVDDPELFFPVGNSGPALNQIEKAKEFCNRCEAREECLTFALEYNQDSGVWGGLSEYERRGIRRKSRRAYGRAAMKDFQE